jgi:hypothetical protein
MSFLVIQHYQFPITDPFKEGHVLTAVEAQVLNWHRARLIQKIVYKWIMDTIEESGNDILSQKEVEGLTARIRNFDWQYELQMAKEPRQGALEYNLKLLAENFLRSRGINVTDLREEDIDRIKRTPEIQARARDLIRSSAFSFDELMA